MFRAIAIAALFVAGQSLAAGPTEPPPAPDPNAPPEVQWMAVQPRLTQMNNEIARQAHLADQARGQSAWWQDCAKNASWCPSWAFSGRTK